MIRISRLRWQIPLALSVIAVVPASPHHHALWADDAPGVAFANSDGGNNLAISSSATLPPAPGVIYKAPIHDGYDDPADGEHSVPGVAFVNPDPIPTPATAIAAVSDSASKLTFVERTVMTLNIVPAMQPATSSCAVVNRLPGPLSLQTVESPAAPLCPVVMDNPRSSTDDRAAQTAAIARPHSGVPMHVRIQLATETQCDAYQPKVAQAVSDEVIPLPPVSTQPSSAPPIHTAQRIPIAQPPQNPVPLSADQQKKKCVDDTPIASLSTNITVSGEMPPDLSQVCHPSDKMPPYAMTPHDWMPVCYRWEAPALCYGPIYFEETNLERYGYSHKYTRAVQPLASSARFFATVPMLPYLVIAEPSCECVYTLGEYRPGSCVPYQWEYPYFSPRFPWQRCEE